MKNFKDLSCQSIIEEGTNARQRGEIQSPRSEKEYAALSPKDKRIIDKRIKNARKQSMSANPGESPRNKKKKINTKQDRERRRSLARHGHITSGDDIAPGVVNDDEMNEAEVLIVTTKKTLKGDFRWMLQTIKYGKNTTVMTGNESSRAKAMAAGKKAKKAASKQKGMTSAAKKNRKGYDSHLAGQDEDFANFTGKTKSQKQRLRKKRADFNDGSDPAENVEEVEEGGMGNKMSAAAQKKQARLEKIKRAADARIKDQKKKNKKSARRGPPQRIQYRKGNEKFASEEEEVDEAGPPTKRPMSPAQKKRNEKHQQFLKVSGMKKSKAPRKAAAKKRAKVGAWSGTRYEDIEREIEEMNSETYAPGNTSTKRNPDFDERQAMYNSNYKRIHKKNPSRGEMRSAGVGKGGDNPKGVKAWKSAMAALKGK